MNPFRSHWLRLSAMTFILTPLIAYGAAATSDVPWVFAGIFTLYIWAFVCVILALAALIALIGRLVGRGIRAIRR